MVVSPGATRAGEVDEVAFEGAAEGDDEVRLAVQRDVAEGGVGEPVGQTSRGGRGDALADAPDGGCVRVLAGDGDVGQGSQRRPPRLVDEHGVAVRELPLAVRPAGALGVGAVVVAEHLGIGRLGRRVDCADGSHGEPDDPHSQGSEHEDASWRHPTCSVRRRGGRYKGRFDPPVPGSRPMGDPIARPMDDCPQSLNRFSRIGCPGPLEAHSPVGRGLPPCLASARGRPNGLSDPAIRPESFNHCVQAACCGPSPTASARCRGRAWADWRAWPGRQQPGMTLPVFWRRQAGVTRLWLDPLLIDPARANVLGDVAENGVGHLDRPSGVVAGDRVPSSGYLADVPRSASHARSAVVAGHWKSAGSRAATAFRSCVISNGVLSSRMTAFGAFSAACWAR